MCGYIYKVTYLKNGKIYIGQKKAKKFLGKRYLGSGKIIRSLVEKEGEDCFEVELIEEIDDESKLDEREIYWIKYYNATNREIGYNISEGGNVNRTMVGENNPFYGKHHSEEAKQKMSENNGRFFLGKQRSEETRQKISESEKGKKVSEETRQKLSYNAKTNPNYGMKGKHLSKEAKMKLSALQKGHTHSRGRIHITNDIEDKMIYPEELNTYIEQGWRKGRKKFSKEACDNISKGHKGHTPHNTGKICINKEGRNKFIKTSEFEYYQQLGWKKGFNKII